MAIYSASPGPLKDLILTLPFKWRPAPTAGLRALKRSESRFHWFAEAKNRNPGLGTLGYLPIEVRHLIYEEIIKAVEEDFEKYWSFHRFYDMHDILFRPLNLRKKGPFGWEPASQNIPALRAASGIIQSEIHQMYLSKTVIESWFPRNNRIGGLSVQQTALVGRIAVDLCPRYNGAFWIKFLRQNPMPNLKTVALSLDHDHGRGSYLKRLSDLSTFRYCDGEACKFGLDMTNTDGRRCKHVQKLFILAKRLRQDLTVFEVIAKVLANNVPNASVQLAQHAPPCSLCYEKCEAILDNTKTHEDKWLIPTLDTTFKWQELEDRISITFEDPCCSSFVELVRLEHFKYFKA
ncbi:MAG: hypothetical protein Q9184_006450 [Pyrenodesmia sp. 2 TL-2023]